MSYTNEGLLKRIEHFEKNVKINYSNLTKDIHVKSRSYFYNIYHYLAREVKNEAEIDLLTEYLVYTGQIDFIDFMNFKKKSPLMKTYVDENKNAQKVHDFLNSPECTLSKERELFNYINEKNLLVWKERFNIKKQLLIERGYAINSKEVIEIDDFIEHFNNQISALYVKTPTFQEKNYCMKKTEAEEIYYNYLVDHNKDEEIIERIREVPSPENIDLEISCKTLYFETISNYWIGNFNASIVLLSVFLEAYLKERYYFKKRKQSNETLIPLINICFSENIINSTQKDSLLIFAENVRNNYVHARTHNIVAHIASPIAKIDFTCPSKPEVTYGDSEELPFLRDLAKLEKDKVVSKNLIFEITEIVEDISKSFEELSEAHGELD